MSANHSAVRRPGSVGRKAPLSTDYADLRDPADGERVPRCKACGMPDRPQALLEPGLWMCQRFQMELTLCRHCSAKQPERVTHCRLCEAAASPGNKVMSGVWAYVHRHVDMLVCEACVIRVAPHFDPRLADPVTLEDVA